MLGIALRSTVRLRLIDRNGHRERGGPWEIPGNSRPVRYRPYRAGGMRRMARVPGLTPRATRCRPFRGSLDRGCKRRRKGSSLLPRWPESRGSRPALLAVAPELALLLRECHDGRLGREGSAAIGRSRPVVGRLPEGPDDAESTLSLRVRMPHPPGKSARLARRRANLRRGWAILRSGRPSSAEMRRRSWRRLAVCRGGPSSREARRFPGRRAAAAEDAPPPQTTPQLAVRTPQLPETMLRRCRRRRAVHGDDATCVEVMQRPGR